MAGDGPDRARVLAQADDPPAWFGTHHHRHGACQGRPAPASRGRPMPGFVVIAMPIVCPCRSRPLRRGALDLRAGHATPAVVRLAHTRRNTGGSEARQRAHQEGEEENEKFHGGETTMGLRGGDWRGWIVCSGLLLFDFVIGVPWKTSPYPRA